MIGYFCQIDASIGGVATTVRLASHDDERLCHLGGFTWWPAIASLPQLRYELFDGEFSGQLSSPTGSLAVQMDAIPVLPALALHGAKFKMWRGEIGAASNAYVPIFDGLIRAQPAIDNGVASIDIGVDDKWLDEPFLATYAGTGGAEGSIDLKGAVKPRLFGAPRFVEAVLVDPVDTIFQLHDGSMQGVELAFDQLSRFAAAKANVATFAQLKALSLSAGEWATCLAQGFVRLGAPPAGQVVFHAQGDNVAGWVRRTGAIVTRIAQMMGAGGKIATTTLSAIDAAIQRNVSVAVTSQTTPRELIQRMAAAINCTAVVSWLGKLVIVPVGLGTPTVDLVSDGSALPPVRSVRQLAADPPFWRMAMTAAVTNRVHSFSEIAFTGTLTPTGDYDPTRVYREGDIVTLLDKSSWLFIDPTPTANSYPSDSNTDWQKLDSAISATNITYADGATIQSLRPGEAGANQTETRVASAIAGQGGLATRGDVYFGSGYILEGAGGAQATLNAFKTALGTASGIVGQGPFATLAQLVFGSPLLSGFGSLAGLNSIFFGSPNLLESSGGSQATLANFKTSSGIASGIAGQGALATKNNVAWTTELTGTPANIAALTGAENIKNTDITITSQGTLAGVGTAGVQVANVQAAFAARRAWDFGNGTTQGVLANNATLSVNSYGVMTVTPTTADPYIRLPLNLPGKSVSVVRARVRLVSGAAGTWDGTGYYTTSGHGHSGSYRKVHQNPGLVAGQWVVLEWDMSALTAGGTDYLDNNIIEFRFDVEQSTNVYEIDWIAVGQYAVDPVAVRGITDNADQTSGNTAAAITGQGSLATLSSLAYGSSFLTGFGGLAGLTSIFFGSPNLLESSGGAQATLANFKTSSGTAAGIAGQGWGATASAAQASNAEVALGSNQTVNSRFARGSYGWHFGNIQGGTQGFTKVSGVNFGSYFGLRDVAYTRVNNGTTPWSASSYVDHSPLGKWGANLPALNKDYYMPVKAGDRIFVSALVGRHRCDSQVFAILLNNDGTLAHAPAFNGGRDGGGLNGDPNTFDRIGGFYNIPQNSTATYACVMVRMKGDGVSTGGDAFIFFTETFLTKVPAGQVAWPEYTDGPADKLADQTSGNTAAAIAGQGALATKSSVAYGSEIAGLPVSLQPSNLFNGNEINFAYISQPGVAKLSDRWPQEGGANKTETRTAAAISGQGWGATASAAQAENAQVRLGKNSVVNSRFMRGTHMWRRPTQTEGAGNIPVEGGVNLAGWYGDRDVAWMRVQTTSAVSSGYYADYVPRGRWSGENNLSPVNYMPVKVSDRIFFSALIGRHRCDVQLYCLVFNRNGDLVQGPSTWGGRSGGGANGSASNFDRVGAFADIVAGDAAYACIMIRLQGNGGAEPYVFFTETMLCQVAPGQTAWPDYNDGPMDNLSDQTGSNTAAAISGQGAFATAPQIGSWNVGSYFNFSAFKLDYSITRADGTTVVTENMSLTALGIAAGFSGQGALATLGSVGTSRIDPSSVVVPYNQTAGDMTVGAGSTIIEMPGFFTVGDGSGGTAIIDFTCSVRSLVDDRQVMFNLLVDTGSGYQGVADTYVGTRSDSGVGTDFKLTAQLKKGINASQVRCAVNCQVQGYNTGGDGNTASGTCVVRQPTLVITGGKR